MIPDSDELTENVEQVVNASSEADLRVRLTVTPGSLRAIGDDSPGLTIVATASEGAKYPAECYTKGVTLAVSRYRQSAHDPTIGHKTTSYLARLAALREAHAEQSFEALWLTPDGRPAEGSVSSLFVVRDQQLLTPPLNTPVLPGITRAAVMELAVDLGVPVREKELSMPELLSADEAFLTNSLMGVMPVVHVGRDPIGTEQPGDTTGDLYSAYEGLIERECAHA
jgi:branched-subunit amino acid aminotransferase/4-amino-4-deoxychorismate lyase